MAAHSERIPFSTSAFDFFRCLAIASTKPPTPSDSVGPAPPSMTAKLSLHCLLCDD
jgi:hypothetical protein